MEPNPVMWFEIYVQDMPRARKFYEAVFKCELQKLRDDEEIEMYAFPMKEAGEGAAGCLAKMKDFNPKGNSVLVYFASEDCSIEEKRVEAAGGKLERPKMSIGEYGFISLALDPEGNMFGIHS